MSSFLSRNIKQVTAPVVPGEALKNSSLSREILGNDPDA
jgi:hypothetical protein